MLTICLEQPPVNSLLLLREYDIYTYADPNDESQVQQDEITSLWVKDLIPKGSSNREPFILVYYPIVDTVADHVNVANEKESNKVVALFGM